MEVVGAEDLLPIVGGARSSSDMLIEFLLRLSEVVLIALPVGTSEKDRWGRL